MTISFWVGPVSIGAVKPQYRGIPHSGNARLHWSVRARWNRAWKKQTALAALAARGTVSGFPLPFALVTVELLSIQPLDRDNAFAAAKPVIDGLKGVLIEDDSEKHIRLDVRNVKVSRKAEEKVLVLVMADSEAERKTA